MVLVLMICFVFGVMIRMVSVRREGFGKRVSGLYDEFGGDGMGGFWLVPGGLIGKEVINTWNERLGDCVLFLFEEKQDVVGGVFESVSGAGQKRRE